MNLKSFILLIWGIQLGDCYLISNPTLSRPHHYGFRTLNQPMMNAIDNNNNINKPTISSKVVTQFIQMKQRLHQLQSNCTKQFLWSLQDMKVNPIQYISIPVSAAIIGYITNWLGVKMIFYPIEWRGIPLYRWTDQPLGIIGWQG